jgi:hypothetical protein
MTPTTLHLSAGLTVQAMPHGLAINGDMSFEQWKSLLQTIQLLKSSYHCVLADHVQYGRTKFGLAEVSVALEQAEFDMADLIKADAIGQLTLDFRGKFSLTAEHFFVLSKVEVEKEQSRWAQIAEREKLSPLELKRSIDAGKILRLSNIQKESGQGSGIPTIQGAVFRFQQWEREIGGKDKLLKLPSADRKQLLDLLTPVVALAASIQESLESKTSDKRKRN